MDVSTLSPLRDGWDHINVYSKGFTEVGKELSNFSHSIIDMGEYGRFHSVEAFWFWLRTLLLDRSWTTDERRKIEAIRELSGFQAKKLGKEILKDVPKEAWGVFPEEEFRDDIRTALRIKLQSKPTLASQFYLTSLPLVHYYFFGEPDNAKVVDAGHRWVVDYLEELRQELHGALAQCFVYRFHFLLGNRAEICTLTDSTKNRWDNVKLIYSLYETLTELGGTVLDDAQIEYLLTLVEPLGIYKSGKERDFLENLGCTVEGTILTVRQFTGIEMVNEQGNSIRYS